MTYTPGQVAARAAGNADALLASLEATVDQLKSCSAWEDALEGEDMPLLRAVNTAESLVASIKGEKFEPHSAPPCDSFRSDGRGCCTNCDNFHGQEA